MLPVQPILQQLGIDRVTADANIERSLLAERVNDVHNKVGFPSGISHNQDIIFNTAFQQAP